MSSPHTSRFKALLVIIIVVAAALAGGYYYWETRPILDFSLSVSPQFFHVAPREGKLLNVSISRSSGFVGQVQVSLMNPPSWVATAPQTINSLGTNVSLPVIAAYNAPKGSVELTIVATSPGAIDQSAQVEMKIVSVQQYTSINGNATIYDTTKSLDVLTKQALVSYANGTLTFSHETPLLQNLTRGDVLIAGLSPPVAPLGFFRLVLSVSQQNGMVVVQTTRASILDAVQEIHVHTSGNSTGGSSSLGMTCFICLGNTLSIIPETTLSPPGLPLNWGAIKADASISFGAGIDYQLDVSLHWPGWTQIAQAGVCFAQSGGNLIAAVACGIAQVDDAHFYLDANAGAEGDITGTPGPVSSGPTDLIPTQDCSSLGVPNSVISCISPIPLFSIGPVGINLGVGFRFVGGATGQLSTNMYVKVSQQFTISIGPEYSNGQFGLHSVPSHSATDDVNLDLAGSNDVKLYAGPEVTVSVDADAGLNLEVGLSAALHAFIEFQSQVPNNPVWWVDGGLEGCVGVNVSAFLMGNWNPPQACGTIVSGRILQQDPTKNPLPPGTPALVIPPADQTIYLSNPAFLDPNLFSPWAGLIPEDPQADTSITCLWYSNLGFLGTSQAQVIGNSLNTGCH
ncbi:MAG TPA: hypothetical protein VEI80_04915, partial [Candidatus Acidoferrales bacterium]|nr:hypothetical protein [Candidatus Acidoferrales bacterium]